MKILLAGEGGLGIQTVAKVLTQAANQQNKFSSYIPSFGVEQRGGVSLAYIQISSKPIPYPRFEKADILVVFCNRALAVSKDFINDETLFIYDNSAIDNKSLNTVKKHIKKYLGIPAQKIAQEKFSTKTLNMIILGALAQMIKEFKLEDIDKQVNFELKEKIAKNPKIQEMNFAALQEGSRLAETFDMSKTELSGTDPQEITQTFEKDDKKWQRFPEYCKGCGLCIARCPVKALTFSKDLGFLGNPIPTIDLDKCTACGLCQKTCPDGAIKVEKK